MPKLVMNRATAALALVVLGTILGAIGAVRIGSIAIALGTAGIAYGERNSARRIDFYGPLVISVALLIVALVLPRGL